jgi:hypothetical protein
MQVLSLSDLAHGRGPLADVCLAIPSLFLSKKNLAGAAQLLASIASMAEEGGGFVPLSAENREPDVFASLWFIRAAHLFNKAAIADAAALPDSNANGEKTLFSNTLLPLNKKILQQIISASSAAGVRMDDGGLLIPQPDKATQTLRLNALWYSALESTGTDLKAAGDRVADHFERLAGRFRRSFAKAYWSDAHGCIWTPESRIDAQDAGLPDPDQLLLTFLCASPIPRTKQRQLLQQVQAKSLPAGSRGVRVRHPVHGVVESPMHLLWMALGTAASADPPGAGLEEARRLVASVGGVRGQVGTDGGGVPAFVVPGEAFSGQPDAVTTAEFLGALATLA